MIIAGHSSLLDLEIWREIDTLGGTTVYYSSLNNVDFSFSCSDYRSFQYDIITFKQLYRHSPATTGGISRHPAPSVLRVLSRRGLQPAMATSSPSSPSPRPSSPHFSSSSRKPVGNRRNLCRWTGCLQDDPFNTVQELVDHVNTKHVDPFQSEELVLCLWEGCKAYNVPCQKKQWLKQHMRRHTNERPHKCIMNGCNQSFWSAELLSHHLQLHLLPSPSPSLSKRKKTTTTNSSETKSTLINEPIPGVQVSNGDTSIPSSACLEPPQPLAINGNNDHWITVYNYRHLLGALIHTDPVDSITMSLIRKSVISQHISASFAVEKRGSEEPVPIPVVTLKGKVSFEANIN